MQYNYKVIYQGDKNKKLYFDTMIKYKKLSKESTLIIMYMGNMITG